MALVIRRILPYLIVCWTFLFGGLLNLIAQEVPVPEKPNILLITVDDMSADSVGVYGSAVPETTPTIDSFAETALRFNFAHVVCGSCKPSRNVMMSGLYPHTNGVEGFRTYPDTSHKLLPDLLKLQNYFVGIYHKAPHTTPGEYAWDVNFSPETFPIKNPESYYTTTKAGIQMALDSEKPFYLNINISDPHLPFYGIRNKSTELVEDPYVPSRLYDPAEMVIPGFLPGGGNVPLELAHYYMSVRRADDSLAKILEAFDEFNLRENTLIVFLSDHGMPQPFAKACIYHHSTHTPLMFSWPGVIEANAVDNEHMVSAVDLMPTLLDVVGSEHPYGLEGKSFYAVLLGETLPGFDHVIKEVDETSNRQRLPMRSVQTKKFGYVFNTWSNGTRDVRNATENTLADQRMTELAELGDPFWTARDNHFEFRAKEEFYDYVTDPNAIVNLIDSPDAEIQAEIDRHRQLLLDWMIRTEDHALEAFRNLTDDEAIEDYWLSQEVDPPILTDLEKMERMFADLDIVYDFQDSAFDLTLDPRLSAVSWDLLFSNDLNLWDHFLLSDSEVTFNEITGTTSLSIDPVGPRMFVKLRGTTADE
jgi:N-sulfoglucosamine sulfohydrolase